MRDNIFIAVANKKVSLSIAKMLITEGIKVTSVVKNIYDMNNIFSYYSSGIIIITYKFDGANINSLMENIPDGFTVILIGNKEQLDNCEVDRVFKLSVPLHKNDLICTVNMFHVFETEYKPSAHKTEEV